MTSDLTRPEKQLFGAAAFVAGAAPVAVVTMFLAAFLFGFHLPAWLTTTGFVVFLVCAGLQFPLTIMFGAIAPEALRDSPLRLRLNHPFSLFVFWWRHIRPEEDDRA